MSATERPSHRSATGIILFLLGLTVYAFAVSLIGDYVAYGGLWAEVLYYAVTGIIWIFPAIRLIRWINAGHDTEA